MLRPNAVRSVTGFLVAAALLLTLISTAWAQTPPAKSPVTIRAGDQETSIVADQIQQVGGATDLTIAVGNVEITRGNTRLLADRVEVNRDTGEAVAQGKVVFFDGGDRLLGDRIDYNLKTGTGVVYNGSAFSAPYYHLSGERLDRIGEGVYDVRRGTFTTCEGDEPSWFFKFGSGNVKLDDLVTGQNASFWARNIPLIPWIPFFAVPLGRERQSGFLFPEFGQSAFKGYFLKVPYYWAINDSQDLTVALDTFSARGIGLEGDYRYILSRDQAGELSAFGVNESFRKTGVQTVDRPENRGWASLQHDWRIAPSLAFKVDATVTSDDHIFRDYSAHLVDRARQFAMTNVSLSKAWTSWSLVSNVMWYQDLTQSRPLELQRVPNIQLTGVRQAVPGAPWLLHETNASFVKFIRDVDGPEGVRTDFHPRFFVPIPVAGIFTVTPFGGGRLTYYDQRVIGLHTAPDGISSQDSVYDPRVRRQIEWGAEAQTQLARVYTMDGSGNVAALEHLIIPRATIIEIRGVDQKAMPTYDPGYRTATGIDPGYERVHGIDGLGKANEVTYSLTDILNAKTVAGPNQQSVRWELMRFTLSQTYNFTPVSQPVGDLYGDLAVQPNQRIRLFANARYNMYGLGLREANADVGVVYPSFSFAAGPRFNEQTGLRTMTAEAHSRVWRNLNVNAATAWDVTKGLAVDSRVGIDWSFDCWAIKVEYINRHQGGNEYRISVNLLGLGETGTSVK